MYSVRGFGSMIADRVRMGAFRAALERTIRPGDVVLDIGTGTGIFALLACRLGARHVYAIEPNEAIQVARETAAANGLGQGITFFQTLSTKVQLPELANVIVADIRGAVPLFEHLIPTIRDARQRLLAPGGKIIPARDTIRAGIVESVDLYKTCDDPWSGNDYGLDLSPGRRSVVNSFHKSGSSPLALLTKPETWAVVDYAAATNPDFDNQLSWTVERGGTGHGLLLWFDSVLAEGVTLTNEPGAPRTVYGRRFYPWEQPVPLAPGDQVRVRLQAKLGHADYLWRWDSEVRTAAGEAKASFRQSTFFARPLSPSLLRKQALGFRPSVGEVGQALVHALGRMDGRHTLEQIARELAACFPGQFSSPREALAYVTDLSQRYAAD